MAEKFLIGDIKSVFWRRAAMIAIIPPILIWKFGLDFLIGCIRALYWATVEGLEAFIDRFRWQFDDKGLRLIKHGLLKMWAKDWPENLPK